MKYLLDTNVFIQAHRFYYPFDVFPAFWSWLEAEFNNGILISISLVLDELKGGKTKSENTDILYRWVVDSLGKCSFPEPDDDPTQTNFQKISEWIMDNRKFRNHAKEVFLNCADPWLIAKAKAEGYTIVTQEKSDPKSRKKIFIPDVCNQFNVPYIDTIQLIRVLGGKF